MNPCVVAGSIGIALTTSEMGDDVVPFHEVMAGASVVPADEAVVDVPVWRGLPFLGVLAWLVAARLTNPGAPVEWWAPKKVLPSVGRTLHSLGWELTADREAWLAPRSVPRDPPGPRGFSGHGLSFDADWGVFSARGIDAGTELLYDVVAGGGPFTTLSDVGTGAGPLAVTLAAAHGLDEVVMSDVDSVALHLAGRNAARAGIAPRIVFGDDATAWPPTAVTVCNFPTHLPRPASDALLAGLVRRARTEPVFLVVHASLRERFAAAAIRLGADPAVMAEADHAVLRLTGRRPAAPGSRRG